MKCLKVCFTLLVLCSITNLNAAIVTLDNNANAPAGAYSTLADAQNAANPGDTIYVKGSPVEYGSGITFFVGKSLTFIGDGYEPDSPAQYPSEVNQMSFVQGVDGVKIIGLKTRLKFPHSHIKNITVERCRLEIAGPVGAGSNSYSNVHFRHNYFPNGIEIWTSTWAVPMSNWLFENNLIVGRIRLRNTNTSTIHVVNNNFILPVNFVDAIDANNISVNNNIFYFNSSIAIGQAIVDNNNQVNYNLFYNLGSTIAIPTGGSNSGGGNSIGQPIFSAGSNPYASGWNALDSTDYELATGSVGENAGSDGTDVGMHGGAYPWPAGFDFNSGRKYKLQTSLPWIRRFFVQTPTVPLNGTINVEVKAIKGY